MAKANGKKLKVIIRTVEREIYDGTADSVTGLGTDGEFTVLPNHIAFMTPLEIGVLTTRDGSREEAIALHAGFLRVENDTVTVLADAAERSQDIDIERAQAAKQRAEDALRRLEEGDRDLDSASAALRRALLRLRVVKKD